MDRADYMTRKFGDPSRLEGAHRRLEEMGREAGITFHFDRIRRSPNTLDAHRVIRWAEPEGLQTRTAMALFRRYFELGEDVSDPGVLRAAAEEAGMDGAAVAALLAGDADRAEVAGGGGGGARDGGDGRADLHHRRAVRAERRAAGRGLGGRDRADGGGDAGGVRRVGGRVALVKGLRRFVVAGKRLESGWKVACHFLT